MARSAVMNFMKQQGFTQEPPDRAALRFKGLQFQPMIVGAMMLVAIVTQSPAIFLLVSALLWLNVLVPAANPFENLYNRFVARRRGRPPLTPDRKSTRLNSSHLVISYAVFCLKK